ncbi:hypothetical protein GCM10011325_46020 [Dyadobacter sediminis]|nr:hypothetical protein GCM10011325_46020 [Dyadobacter sediminis]
MVACVFVMATVFIGVPAVTMMLMFNSFHSVHGFGLLFRMMPVVVVIFHLSLFMWYYVS